MQISVIGQSTLDFHQPGEAKLQEICDRFPAEPLSGDERDVLIMLAAGLSPQSIVRQVGFSSGLVDILSDSIMSKFRSNTIEQAVGRAVSVGTLQWTDFFANPVLEVVDRDQRVLLGGIVHWTRNNYEIISFDWGRQVWDLTSFVPVEAVTLSRRFQISVEAVNAAFDKDAYRKVWIRNL
ncbi:helix-turn-helix transcriptional regulator [Ruegeria hyattellae]|uniref:helix-turn-helix transcriptional regulator n=1 Tax=Ruegeria hyattellae TaxID=3233337 RepID=UPI00355BF638